MLALLAVDGALSAVAAAFLLPFYLGSVAFPVSALVSGLTNAALVWVAGCWTPSPRVAALPLWTWLLVVIAILCGDVGGNRILDGQGILHFSVLLLLGLGLAPPFWVLRRGQISDSCRLPPWAYRWCRREETAYPKQLVDDELVE